MRGCVNGPRPMPAQAMTKQEAGWHEGLLEAAELSIGTVLVFAHSFISSTEALTAKGRAHRI